MMKRLTQKIINRNNLLMAGLMNLRKNALPTASKLCFGNRWWTT